ncbi:Dabb family protein [Streptomyces sp. NPDC091217]|uniref:Dabb family protein n=1 Tax=Streptomyces sp. NPDC091217 TaxID=3365975 RepID=UPI0038240586
MITHIVLFKFRPGVDWSDPRALVAEKVTEGHRTEIDDIVNWRCGRDVSERSDAYDFAVIGEFLDSDALARYQHHPCHRRGVELWSALATWVVTDLVS